MKQVLFRQYQKLLAWGGRVFLGLHRLEHVETVPLLSSMEDALSLYGDQVESKPCEHFPAAREHSFEVSPYHGVVVYEWKGLIHSIVFWSARSDPVRDLAYVMKQYGEGGNWEVLTEGYLYRRMDGKVNLWCSAIPAIGLGTCEFLEAEAVSRAERHRSTSGE